jgi:predicted RNA-binding protein associated with RNAse of E/G family
VNLQEPLRRTPIGFDTADQLLDLVRSPRGEWRWKDEHELVDAVARGYIGADEAATIRAEGERVIANDGFPTGWEDFEPDPTWQVPRLPSGWNEP